MMRPLVLAAATLATAALVLSTPRWTTETTASPPQPADAGERFEPVTLDDVSVGELLEGDGPLERLAPGELDVAVTGIAQSEIPVPDGMAIDFRSYSTNRAVASFLTELESAYPALAERVEIGRSWRGDPIYALRVARSDVADQQDAEEALARRPAMYTDAQHHARELISKEVTLYTLWWLLAHYGEDAMVTHLLDTRVSWFVPSVNVDGNEVVLQDDQSLRKTTNPTCCDDDEDGAFDEDPPVGVGYGTFALQRWTFDDEWAEMHPDNPFADGWQEHLAGRPESLGFYRGDPTGEPEPIPREDADGDGEAWEDPVGGVDSNRNYDWHWEDGDPRIPSGTFRGPEAFSEPQTRAVRDLIAGIPHLATALSYHSGIDLILFPWGYSREAELQDAHLFERLGRKGSELTEVHGFSGSPHVWTARGLYGGAGSTMDWLYGNRGAVALSPEVYGGDGTLSIRRVGETGAFTVARSTGAQFNPAPDEILSSVDRWRRYALYLLAATPNVELNDATVIDGALILTLGNDGYLPVEVELTAGGSSVAVAGPVGEPTVLSAATDTWRIPLPNGDPPGDVSVQVTATLQVGTVPHVVETAGWTLRIGTRDDTARTVDVVRGQRRDFVDLSERFGGWEADPSWGARQYTCGPGGCSNIRLPGDPTPVTPVETPTPQASPTLPVEGEGDLYLPRLLSAFID